MYFFLHFKLQWHSKYSLFDTIHLWGHFFYCLNSFWTHWFWCPLVLLLLFFVCLFHLFHIGKMFPFEDFFHLGKQTKEVTWAWDQVNREGGEWCFSPKVLNTRHSVGRWTCKPPIMKWAKALKEFSRKNYWRSVQPVTTPPDVFLEHWLSSGSLYYKWPTLQKIFLVFLGFP